MLFRSTFEQADLIDEYIVQLAGVIAGGNDSPGMFIGSGDATAADISHGDVVSVTPYGDDLEIIFNPRRAKVRQ